MGFPVYNRASKNKPAGRENHRKDEIVVNSRKDSFEPCGSAVRNLGYSKKALDGFGLLTDLNEVYDESGSRSPKWAFDLKWFTNH